MQSSRGAGPSVLTEHQDPGTTPPAYQLCTWSVCRCEFQCWFLAQGSSQQQELKSWEWDHKWWEAALAEPVTNLVTCSPQLLLWGTQDWGVCYSGQIVGIQGSVWVTLPLNKLVAALVIDTERLVCPVFWWLFLSWALCCRDSTACSALLLFSGIISREELPPSLVLCISRCSGSWLSDAEGWVFPGWSLAFIMEAFCVLWSPFLSLTEIVTFTSLLIL